MFGIAAICWATWKSRNRARFEMKVIKNPTLVKSYHLLVRICVFGQVFIRRKLRSYSKILLK
jgi:hypothetical protein